MSNKIRILMATYNGEKYLSEQIESILNQTYTNWELHILDDCSTDATLAVIEAYMKKDARIFCQKNTQNMGQVATFDKLLISSKDEEYVMFCDQDDVWNENKIELSMERMKAAEKMKKGPILVYTDLDYVDESLKPISIRKPQIENRDLKTLYSFNFAWGCTMLLNHELIKQSIGFSEKAENHDYWIHMIAMITGQVCYLEIPTLKYRQHADNVTGGMNNRSIRTKMRRLKKVYSNFSVAINQNKIISKMYPENKESQEYLKIFSHSYFYRIYLAKKFGLKKSTKKENILFYMFLFLRRN